MTSYPQLSFFWISSACVMYYYYYIPVDKGALSYSAGV